jgi:cytochrome oxidase Cu insertion factor (SCO1/SenC/PrrC family)
MSRRALVLLGLAAAVVVAATFATRNQSGDGDRTSSISNRYRGSVVPDGIHLPQFALRDETGRTVAAADLRGRIVVLTFLDTDCTESCPIIADVTPA